MAQGHNLETAKTPIRPFFAQGRDRHLDLGPLRLRTTGAWLRRQPGQDRAGLLHPLSLERGLIPTACLIPTA
jgi:hypothetical protein